MSTPISPAVAERAVEWLLALQSPPVSAATLAAWNHWRQADPQHEAAWQRIEGFTQRIALGDATARAALTRASLAPVGGLGRRTAVKGLVLLLGAGAAGWSARESGQWQRWSADYRSAVGEQRRVELPDGSHLLLNTDSAVDLAYDSQRRGLRLLAGEVLVQARDDARPLQLLAAHGRLQSQQARFAVRQFDDFSQLLVHSGQVQATPLGAPSQAQTIGAGQWLRLDAHGVLQRRALTESDLAWADGMLIASDQRLDAVLAELRRYRRGHLGCAAGLAGLRVSGTFPLVDTERVIDSLAQSLHLEVRRFTRYWVELGPRASA